MNSEHPLTSTTIQELSRRNSYDLDFSDIHQSIDPADIRSHERILARIRKRESDSAFESIRVWRLSPLGVELLADQGMAETYQKGQSIDLELVLSGQRTLFEGLVVDVQLGHEGAVVFGVRLSRKVESSTAGVDRRTVERWICSDEFLPTCVAPTPGRFDDFMYFQVRDISAEGLQLSCRCFLRNKFLIPGMRMSLTTVLPMAQVIQLEVEVVRVAIAAFAGRDRLVDRHEVQISYRLCEINSRPIHTPVRQRRNPRRSAQGWIGPKERVFGSGLLQLEDRGRLSAGSRVALSGPLSRWKSKGWGDM